MPLWKGLEQWYQTTCHLWQAPTVPAVLHSADVRSQLSFALANITLPDLTCLATAQSADEKQAF